MARTKKPTAADLKKANLVKLILDVSSSGDSKDSWNPAEISEGLKNINFIRRLVDTWNPAQLNEAIRILGFKTIDTWNPAVLDEMKAALIRCFMLKMVTGNPIELNLSGDLPYEIKSLTLTMNPIQSGTGDPSPSNIRPISGRDSVDVSISGKNYVNTDTVTVGGLTFTEDSDYYISVSPNNTDQRQWRYSNGQYQVTLPQGEYQLVIEVKTISSNASNNGIRGYDASNTVVVSGGYNPFGTVGIHAYPFTLSEETQVSVMTKLYDGVTRIMIIPSMASTDYTPYVTPRTKTITFPSTIYGGTDEVVGGNGTSTYGYITSYNGEALPGYWISDRDVYAEGTTPTTGAEVCYELATPTPFSTTPITDLELNKGTNIISSDADDIELKYQINLS